MSMKLIIAIVHSDDAQAVLSEISMAGYSATKLSTTGGFMRAGNTTLLIGVEQEQVDEVIALIGKRAHSHKQVVSGAVGKSEGSVSGLPFEVKVGGATVFVVDVEKFVKL